MSQYPVVKQFLMSGLVLLSLAGCSGMPLLGETPENELQTGNNVYNETGGIRIVNQRKHSSPAGSPMADQNFQSSNYIVAQQNGAGSDWAVQYNKKPLKTINHYARGIMHDLVNNLDYVNSKTPIGVSSFIFLDGDFYQANLLGNQLAESFLHEIHQFGIPVIDFKTTDYIRVTEKGDFVFSRDFLELKDNQPIKYVLAGTLVKHQGGILVNARIVGLESKAVVASAQGFLPENIVSALLPSQHHDGIRLTQG